ncbi:MAG: hypothetical protein P9L99_09830 [Candidatus Lernaella stagnicola]|nr:hypothetical protein [Candidatus Lernaella stagnicola]
MPTYAIADFFKTGDIVIDPRLHARPTRPLTMEAARELLLQFALLKFDFEQSVKAMLVYDYQVTVGTEQTALGFLFEQTVDEMGQMKVPPKPVGRIEFHAGGPDGPTIKVFSI